MKRGIILTLLVVCSAAGPLYAGGGKTLGKTTPEWIQLLENGKTTRIRSVAVIALTVIGPSEKGVVNSLKRSVLKDKSAEIRQAAALALGEMGVQAKSAVRTLEESLAKDKSAIVRAAAARALGGEMLRYSKQTIDTLADALRDKEAKVRAAAITTLKEHGADAREVIADLLKAAKNNKLDRFTRTYAMRILSTFKNDGAKVVPLLIGILNGKKTHYALKEVAVDGLDKFIKQANPAKKVLLDLFNDKQAPVLVRRNAAVTLTKLKPSGKFVWPVAKNLMGSQNSEIRSQAVRLAGAVCGKEPELVSALMRLCIDPNQEVQLAAVQELGELGAVAKQATKTLRGLANASTSDTILKAVKTALKKING